MNIRPVYSHSVFDTKEIKHEKVNMFMLLNQNYFLAEKLKSDVLSPEKRDNIMKKLIDTRKEIDARHGEMIRRFREQEQKDWDAYIDAKPNSERRYLKRDLHDRMIILKR